MVGKPGGEMPYGLQQLHRSFDLHWSDAAARGIWRSRVARHIGGLVRRCAPGLQGSLVAFLSRKELRAADMSLSLFEDAGLGLARWQVSFPSRASCEHVLIVCWLAEDLHAMNEWQKHSIARSLRSETVIAVFSSNQIGILSRAFGVPRSRIHTVPFGVDTRYYDPTASQGTPGGAGVVVVGSDSRRDYRTLFEAVPLMGAVRVTLVCAERNLRGLTAPRGVDIRFGIPHSEYRDLLNAADLVVTPTTGPAYPSGQSVVLEAMSMGRATLTTDSVAMREYVHNDVDGVLVPAFDAEALAHAAVDLLHDPGRLSRLGGAAATSVREHFTLERMWSSIGSVLAAAADS